jgi:hypothetical protein
VPSGRKRIPNPGDQPEPGWYRWHLPFASFLSGTQESNERKNQEIFQKFHEEQLD